MEEPAFLRRLRQGHSGFDQQQREIAPRNKKRPKEDDEDAPAYVMEDGAEITAEEYKTLAAGGEKATEPEENTREEKQSPIASKDNIMEAGVKSNKRKAVKMVAGVDANKKEDKKSKPKRKAQKVKLSFQ